MNARATATDELDYLDQALLVWAREIPDLDPLTEGIVERIHILAHHLNVSSDRRWPSSTSTGARSGCSAGCAASVRRTSVRPGRWPTTCSSRAAR